MWLVKATHCPFLYAPIEAVFPIYCGWGSVYVDFPSKLLIKGLSPNSSAQPTWGHPDAAGPQAVWGLSPNSSAQLGWGHPGAAGPETVRCRCIIDVQILYTRKAVCDVCYILIRILIISIHTGGFGIG